MPVSVPSVSERPGPFAVTREDDLTMVTRTASCWALTSIAGR